MTCWCGQDRLVPFGGGYHRCGGCQTLVSDRPADVTIYGRDYWFGHQTGDLNLPDITTRSRTDLADRTVHWLRTILRYRQPPADVLEIGCGHGGLLALLTRVGYRAAGLELDASIVDYARRTFGVDVEVGPLESHSDRPPVDVIVLIDVLEHLPDPVATIRLCREKLNPGGVVYVQTPSYPEESDLPGLLAAGHKFPQMLDPAEHLFLFSRSSAVQLFDRCGLAVDFVPAVFDFYDMAFIAGVQPPHPVEPPPLSATPDARLVQAMLDIDLRRLDLLAKYRSLRRPSPS